MNNLIDAFNNKEIIDLKRTKYIVNPLTDHYPETSFQLMDEAVQALLGLTDFSRADKIVAEEDRGGFLAALVAYRAKKALSMVKWNPLDLPGQIGIDFRNAYAHGKMYLYGVRPGDKVILVEDLIDSGGTIVSMIELLKKAKVQIIDVICLAEKEEMQGVARIKRETGINVKYFLKFNCEGAHSRVTEVQAQPYNN